MIRTIMDFQAGALGPAPVKNLLRRTKSSLKARSDDGPREEVGRRSQPKDERKKGRRMYDEVREEEGANALDLAPAPPNQSIHRMIEMQCGRRWAN